MEGKVLLGAALNQVLSLGSFIILAHYFGPIVQDLKGDAIIIAVLLGLLVPFVLLMVNSLSTKIRRVMPLVAGILCIVGCYGLILSVPNYVIPSVSTDDLMVAFFMLALGATMVSWITSLRPLFSSLALLMAEGITGNGSGKAGTPGEPGGEVDPGTSSASRGPKSGLLLQVIIYAAGGCVAGLALLVGISGWLYPVMFICYMVPAGLLVHYLFVPAGEVPENGDMGKNDRKRSWIMRQDKAHPFKMTMFSLGEGVALIFTVIAAGMNTSDLYLVETRWVFWLAMVAATGAGFCTGAWLVRSGTGMLALSPDRKDFVSAVQRPWLVAALMSLVPASIVIALELFVPAYHGTQAAAVVDGVVGGFGLGTFFSLTLALNQGRRRWYPSLAGFLLSFVLVAATYASLLITGTTLQAIAGFEFVFPLLPLVFLALVAIPQVMLLGKKTR